MILLILNPIKVAVIITFYMHACVLWVPFGPLLECSSDRTTIPIDLVPALTIALNK